ncbi:MAG: hypothetical protein WBW80_02270 [Acidimicrobiales bacterium]
MVQSIGSGLCFVVIPSVFARSRLLFGSLPNDTELFVGVLDDLLQSLLKVHRYLLRWIVVVLHRVCPFEIPTSAQFHRTPQPGSSG